MQWRPMSPSYGSSVIKKMVAKNECMKIRRVISKTGLNKMSNQIAFTRTENKLLFI